MNIKRTLLLIVSLIAVTGCGRSEQGAGSGGQTSPTRSIATMELTSAAIPTVTSGPIIFPPTPNPYPVQDGNTIIITSDAYFSRKPPTNTVCVGQQVRITRPKTVRWGYNVVYDQTLLLPDVSTNLQNPAEQGWIWTATRAGATTITINELRRPCSGIDCPDGGMPPRTIKIELDIKP